jgi:hypothetical protein
MSRGAKRHFFLEPIMQKRHFLRAAFSSALALGAVQALAKDTAQTAVPASIEPSLSLILDELVTHLSPLAHGESATPAVAGRVRELALKARTEHERFEDKTIAIHLISVDAVDPASTAKQREVFASCAVHLCGSLLKDLRA